MDKHWGRWEEFCLENSVDPYLQTWDDPVPIIQVFGERYHDGILAPKQHSAKSRTVEDALRDVGQAHARLGPPDPRKDHHGKIDFRIQRDIKAYEKSDNPPRRVKPIPMSVILYILEQAYGDSRTLANTAIADMICIAVSSYSARENTLEPPPTIRRSASRKLAYTSQQKSGQCFRLRRRTRLRDLCLLHLHDAKERNSRRKTGPRQK
jgi:hypothetical protein